MRTLAVYEGTIRHRRFAVRSHEFRHRIVMAYVDADPAEVRSLAPGTTRVRKLTLPRRFGKLFNPVSFYYCFDDSDRLRAVVAEVTSTPWGERHAYVLERSGGGRVLHGDFAKRLHVSPFMGMEQRYSFHAAEPGETVSVHIESTEAGARAFDATLNLRKVAAGRRVRATTPWRVLTLIYAHALVIRIKGIRSHPHPRRAAA